MSRRALLEGVDERRARALEQPVAHLVRVVRLEQHVERLAVHGRLFEELHDRARRPLRLPEAVAVDRHRQARGLDAAVALGALVHQLLEDGRRLVPRAGAGGRTREPLADGERRQLRAMQAEQDLERLVEPIQLVLVEVDGGDARGHAVLRGGGVERREARERFGRRLEVAAADVDLAEERQRARRGPGRASSRARAR